MDRKKPTDRQIDIHTETDRQSLTDRDRQTATDRQTDRQTDRHADNFQEGCRFLIH